MTQEEERNITRDGEKVLKSNGRRTNEWELVLLSIYTFACGFERSRTVESSIYSLVHGLFGVSDSARRYPERHAHTDAPLMEA